VGAVLEADHLTQSFSQLEMEFSATLDQDNPLSSRYLRVFPRATVFGWTKSAPGERSLSQLSLPYHIAHIARLTDDRSSYFKNPGKELDEEVAAHYAVSLLNFINREELEEVGCSYIDEQTAIDAWLYHGQAKKIDGQPLPFSFDNKDLQAFPSLISGGNSSLQRAKELDCLLKQKLSPEQKEKVLDEILASENLLGYNFHGIWELLQREEKEGNFTALVRLRKKLQQSEVLKHFLMRKLAASELGILRKIDYYAFYLDMTGEVIEELKDKSKIRLKKCSPPRLNQKAVRSGMIISGLFFNPFGSIN
ncbi:MAG: hypothetical protein OXB92_16560, partial [Acidimicrobiaceae bacterium]|nr:hypothetical protein [Acidimicrobiaceae bacterium]